MQLHCNMNALKINLPCFAVLLCTFWVINAQTDQSDLPPLMPQQPPASSISSPLASHLRHLSFEERTKEFILSGKRRFGPRWINPEPDRSEINHGNPASEELPSRIIYGRRHRRDVDKEEAHETFEKVKDVTSDLLVAAGEQFSAATDKAKNYSEPAYDVVRGWVSSAADGVSRAAVSVRDYFNSTDLETTKQQATEKLKELREKFNEQREKLAEQYRQMSEVLGERLKEMRKSKDEKENEEEKEKDKSWKETFNALKAEAEKKWRQMTQSTDDDQLPPGITVEEENVFTSLIKRIG